jgi:hypothetical protein
MLYEVLFCQRVFAAFGMVAAKSTLKCHCRFLSDYPVTQSTHVVHIAGPDEVSAPKLMLCAVINAIRLHMPGSVNPDSAPAGPVRFYNKNHHKFLERHSQYFQKLTEVPAQACP